MKEVQLGFIPGLGKIGMSWWRTAAPNELCFELLIPKKDFCYWSSIRSHPAELWRPDNRSLTVFSLGAGGHCVPRFHCTFSEQVCRYTIGFIERKYHHFSSMSRSKDSSYDLASYSQWNSRWIPSKAVGRLRQQKSACGDIPVAGKYKMLLTIVGARRVQQCRREWNYWGKEIYHFTKKCKATSVIIVTCPDPRSLQ